jgi:hypothetical protein
MFISGQVDTLKLQNFSFYKFRSSYKEENDKKLTRLETLNLNSGHKFDKHGKKKKNKFLLNFFEK